VPIPTPAQQAQIRPSHTPQAQIRNFCIIAHIDHGKSTLADRMLQLTGVVEAREMRDQYLDRMDIERERGITIKSQAVRMPWAHKDTPYALNMIDTPGHVDFTYEVSRSLAACEGAVLLIDAAQGIEAQTLANLYLALENDLAIIPVLNKIDLPGAQPEKYAHEVAQLIGCDEDEVLKVSGKTGEGVEALLDRIVEVIPAPEGDPDAPTRAMIFDSVYDTYRGVVTYVRVVDGVLSTRQRVRMMSTGATHELLELGVISPEPKPEEGIGAGEVGYLITGVKDVRQSRVGDTVTSQVHGATEALAGYRDPNPMVFSGIYPVDGSDFPDLRDALERLQLNDAALRWVLPPVASDGENDVMEFRPTDFVASTDTLYCLSQEGRGSASPIVTALTVAVIEAALEHTKTQPGGRLALPLFVALDEAANVCRWRELPDLYSHFGSRGIVVDTLLQSWSQGASVWGDAGMNKLWSAANVKAYGGGVSEDKFLQSLSTLIGMEYVDQVQTSSSQQGGTSRSVSVGAAQRPIAPVSELMAMPPNRAWVFASGAPAVYVRTVPYWETKKR